MNTIVGGVEGCTVYLGDVVVHSNTWRNHVQIRQLFDSLTSLCRNFSAVMALLTDLLKAQAKYFWSTSCQQAFNNVKGRNTPAQPSDV